MIMQHDNDGLHPLYKAQANTNQC